MNGQFKDKHGAECVVLGERSKIPAEDYARQRWKNRSALPTARPAPGIVLTGIGQHGVKTAPASYSPLPSQKELFAASGKIRQLPKSNYAVLKRFLLSRTA